MSLYIWALLKGYCNCSSKPHLPLNKNSIVVGVLLFMMVYKCFRTKWKLQRFKYRRVSTKEIQTNSFCMGNNSMWRKMTNYSLGSLQVYNKHDPSPLPPPRAPMVLIVYGSVQYWRSTQSCRGGRRRTWPLTTRARRSSEPVTCKQDSHELPSCFTKQT